METAQAARRGVTVLYLSVMIAITIITLTVVAPALQRLVDPAEAARHADALRLAQARDTALAPLRLLLARVGLGTVIVLLIALAGAALAGMVAVWRYLPARATATAGMVYPRYGLLPAQMRPADAPDVRIITAERNPQAEWARALAAGAETSDAEAPRISAAALRQLARPPEPVIDAQVDLLPADVLAPDLAQRPHKLLIGESGAGKTNTLYQAISTFRRYHGDAEVMVCSLVRKDWPDLSASTPATIYAALEAVAQEMQRRDELMSSRGLREFRDTGLPPVLLVVDEAEAIGDEFNRRELAEFKGRLRNVIRMGRNFGVAGLFGTQLARRDMFDPTAIDNMGTVIIHRVSRTVAAQFQIWDPRVTRQILTLPTGRAYDLRREAFVSFPRVAQPRLRLSDLYHEPAVPLLPADAEADGLGADDLSDGVVGAGGTNGDRQFWSQSRPAGNGVDIAPPELATEMYRYWRSNGESLRAVEEHFNPGATPGGWYHYYAAATINAMLRRRGRPERYKERDQ